MPDSNAPEEIQPDRPAENALAAEPEPAPLPLAPVAGTERIAALDVLRGIAVFGILLINMPLFVAPPAAFFEWQNNLLWSGTADRIVTALLAIFAQGKFYTLFSFLFGLGFGVQMMRARERHSPDFKKIYRRRLAILLLIGVLHFFLIWWGDVLHVYALLGFLLFAFREDSNKSLLIWVLCMTFIPLTLALAGTTAERLAPGEPAAEREKKQAEEKQKSRAKFEQEMAVYAKGSFGEILAFRLKGNVRHLKLELFWSVELLTSFLLGLWVSRKTIMQDPGAHKPLLMKLAGVALPLGLLVTTADVLYNYFHPNQTAPLWKTHLAMIREFLARPAMAFGYAAILLLIGIHAWMRPFAAAGRMALTNYLLHSLVFTTVANGYGMGLYGQIPPTTQVLLCVGFYALQLPFSVWWLRTHAYGPAEWAWRGLTYGVRPSWKSNV